LHIQGTARLIGTNRRQFKLSANTCTATVVILPTATCKVTVVFAPTFFQLHQMTASIWMSDDAAGSPQTVRLFGRPFGPSIVLDPTNIDFGAQPVGTHSPSHLVHLTNVGNDQVTITRNPALIGFNPRDWVIRANQCVPGKVLRPGATCTLEIRFAPVDTGSLNAQIKFFTDVKSTSNVLPVRGFGTLHRASASSSIPHPSSTKVPGAGAAIGLGLLAAFMRRRRTTA
jgi:hypothetical protein